VDVLVVGFPDAQLDGTIADALAELVANGTIRLLDMLIVYVDESGTTTVAEITDIDGDGVPDLIAMQIDTPGLLTDADAAAAVEGLPPASAVLLIAWENTWAIRASMALREKGGVLLGFHRIPVTEIDAAMDELDAVILEEVEG
jgi:hypothetical protein